MVRALQLHTEKNSAMQRISDMLTRAFNEVGEKIRADLLAAYRANAEYWHKKFMQEMVAAEGRISKSYAGAQWWDHTDFDQEAAKIPWGVNTWEEARKHRKFFSLTYKTAEKRANDAYESARDSFVHKNLNKLREVLGKREDLKNGVLKFDWKNGAFVGNVQIYLEGAYFRGELTLKYVIRRIPRVTPYFQYPLVFTEAEVGGKHYAHPSEDELRVLLGGVSKQESAEQLRAAAIASGMCLMSGKPVPEKLIAPIRMRTSPYVKCPECSAVVSAQHWKFRAHKTPAGEKSARGQKLETAGYCPMSREKVPAEILGTMWKVEPYKDPKGFCPTCKQQVRLDAERDWIFPPGGDRPTQMVVKSARYYKHKLEK